MPSSTKIRTTPRPLNASGFTWRLIFSASSGSSTFHIQRPTISKHQRTHAPTGKHPAGKNTHHLANARQAARGRLHHHLALALAKRVREAALVVLHDEVVEVRLPAELVHALRDLVARRVPEPREQRHQPPAQRRRGVLAEDDR